MQGDTEEGPRNGVRPIQQGDPPPGGGGSFTPSPWAPQHSPPPPPLWQQQEEIERAFVSGCEPPAPPLQELGRSSSCQAPEDKDDGFLARLRSPYIRENETLGSRLLDAFGCGIRKMFRSSHMVLRLDMHRPMRFEAPVARQRRIRRGDRRANFGDHQPGGFISSAGSSYGRHSSGLEDDWPTGNPSKGWLGGIEGGGVRLKLMQIWDFPDKVTGAPRLPWDLNFGVGGRIEMDRGGRLEPHIRLRAKHVALRLLPEPLLEMRGRWPLGGTQLAINVHYRSGV